MTDAAVVANAVTAARMTAAHVLGTAMRRHPIWRDGEACGAGGVVMARHRLRVNTDNRTRISRASSAAPASAGFLRRGARSEGMRKRAAP